MPAHPAARALCLLPLALGLALTLLLPDAASPLALPLLGGLGLGFALRRPGPRDLLLLAAATLALLAPWSVARLIGGLALLLIGLLDARRLAALPVALGGGAVSAAVALDPVGPATVLVQLRLLALAGGGGVVAVLGLAALAGPADGPGRPAARRAAALAALVGLYALCTDAAAAWPDGWRLTTPFLIWSAPALALLALLGARSALVALAPAAAAVLGAASATGLGLDGAAWALAGAGLALGLADERGQLTRWTAGLLGGLPPGLPFAAAGLALWAAATAVHPAPLRLAAALTAGLILLAGVRAITTPSAGRTLALVGALVGSGLLFVGLRPTAPAAERAATAIDRRRLPIDDMRGWRRLSRLDAPPPAGPPDAGVP